VTVARRHDEACPLDRALERSLAQADAGDLIEADDAPSLSVGERGAAAWTRKPAT
jgi:hypothetical protein